MRYIIFVSLFLSSILLSTVILYTVSSLNNTVLISNILSENEEPPSQKKSNSNTLTFSNEDHDCVFIPFNINFFTGVNEMIIGYLMQNVKSVFVEIITPPPLW